MAFSASMTVPPNGIRFSRREASAASEAVGWKRLLGRRLQFIYLEFLIGPSEDQCIEKRNDFYFTSDFKEAMETPAKAVAVVPLPRKEKWPILFEKNQKQILLLCQFGAR
jgi:hypothetical protein